MPAAGGVRAHRYLTVRIQHGACRAAEAAAVSLLTRVSEGLAGASFEQQRRLVELLIDRVIVTEEEVEVRYVIPTSRSGEYGRFCHLRTNYLLSVSTFLSRCRGD